VYHHLTRLEDNSRPWDTDSAVGSDGDVSSTGSLSSSIFNYEYENGRTYHAFRDGKYIMPNDDKEQVANETSHIEQKWISDRVTGATRLGASRLEADFAR
jgi:hypothetical protein